MSKMISRAHTSLPPYIRRLVGHPFRTVIAVAKFFAFAHLFTEYGVVTAPCQGPSMLPTFDILGEWILISRFHRFGRNVELGDLVAYNIPINHERGVKRILGMPGDYVLVDSGSNAMIQVRTPLNFPLQSITQKLTWGCLRYLKVIVGSWEIT